MTKDERRKHPRISWRAPATFTSGPQGLIGQAQTVDLSRGGSLIRGPIPLEAGSGLELRIDLGEFCLAPIDASVKRTDPGRRGAECLLALEFSELQGDLMDAVHDALDGPETLDVN